MKFYHLSFQTAEEAVNTFLDKSRLVSKNRPKVKEANAKMITKWSYEYK